MSLKQELYGYMAEMVCEHVPNVRKMGTKLNFRCPICGDGRKSSSKRGYFYIETGSYYCWNGGCPANGSGMSGLKFLSHVTGLSQKAVLAKLIRRAGSINKMAIDGMINDSKIGNLFGDCVSRYRKDGPVKRSETVFEEKVRDGEWTYELPEFVENYISERKLMSAPYLPEGFRLLYDNVKKRLVIPWNESYYQERKLYRSQADEDKYLFPSGIEKPVFGLERLDRNFKYIFLLEGVFDSIWVKNGVAVGSLTLSNHQMDILRPYENDGFKIVYMMDNQFADKSSFNETLRISKRNPFQGIFLWNRKLKRFKDVNESVMFDDRLKDLWKSEKFLTGSIERGASLELKMMDGHGNG